MSYNNYRGTIIMNENNQLRQELNAMKTQLTELNPIGSIYESGDSSQPN